MLIRLIFRRFYPPVNPGRFSALKRVIQIDQGTGSIASAEHAIALNHYAKMLAATNRPDEAAREFRKAVAILKSSLGVEHTVTKGVADNFANLLKKYPQHRESGDPQWT